MKNRLVEYARLEWRNTDDESQSPKLLPHSTLYDDIYFADDGVAETTHVFLNSNTLSERFKTSARFAIGETGFGTGLNILAAWDLWRKSDKPANATLNFLSFEKFPLHKECLEKAHSNWTEFTELSKIIRDQWPPNITGFHRLDLEEGVGLTLYFGDILDGIADHPKEHGIIDAWFLDGFAPAKNPDIWSQPVFDGMAKLSRPKATFATFTVAGNVRRGLAQAGFAIEKIPGFGRKREMLRGQLTDNTILHAPLMNEVGSPSPNASQPPKTNVEETPWFSTATLSPITSGSSIAIIGGGIAGASLAYALRQACMKPCLFEKTSLAAGASGNRAGLIMPRLDRDDNPPARFSIHAWVYTLRLLSQLQKQYPDTALFNQCGAAKYGRDDRSISILDAIAKEEYLPEGWIEAIEDGHFFPHGGVVSPPDFVKLLLGDTPLVYEKVISLNSQAQNVHITTEHQDLSFDAVIIANGLEALRFLPSRSLPISGSAGQIDVYENAPAPEHAKVYGPYIAPLPAAPHPQKGMVAGATYRPLNKDSDILAPRLDATQENLDSLQPFTNLDGLAADQAHSRASVRCVTPDQLPIAGPLPDWAYFGANYDRLRDGRIGPYPLAQYQPRLFTLIGLGSRGLVTAPLAAAMITSQIANIPAPVTADIFNALHPARFFIRSIKRPKGRHQK